MRSHCLSVDIAYVILCIGGPSGVCEGGVSEEPTQSRIPRTCLPAQLLMPLQQTVEPSAFYCRHYMVTRFTQWP